MASLPPRSILHVEAKPQSPLKAPEDFRVIGKPLPRVDIPGKVTGGVAYVQDLRLDGMVHARVVRPPSYGATLASVDTARVEAMPGVISVVRDGNFLAVVAEREYQAVAAMRALAAAAQWAEKETLPDADRSAEGAARPRARGRHRGRSRDRRVLAARCSRRRSRGPIRSMARSDRPAPSRS